MVLVSALALAASSAVATVSVEAPASRAEEPAGRGVQIAAIQVSAQILRPAVVRQASGWEPGHPDAPRPAIVRHGRRILVEFQ